jgi:hypothetical protein
MRNVSAIVVCLWSLNAFAQTQTSSADRASVEAAPIATPHRAEPVAAAPEHSGGIHWRALIEQWLLNLGIEQTERIAQQAKTRNALSGPFFQDWFETVTTYHFDHWDDNDKFITSNLAHPMQGAIVEAIFWQNNDHVRFSDQDFHSKAYRKALLQAFAFAAFDAVQFKLGPLSESSIGNVGLPAHWWDKDCKQLNIPCDPRTGLNDLILNEVGGTALTIGFQWLDKHVQKRIEDRFRSRAVIDTTRIMTNPPQSVANIMRFRRPWYRDNRNDH